MNTGKPSEKRFDDYWNNQGKKSVSIELVDSSKINGRNKSKGSIYVPPTPCDRLLVVKGQGTIFAEVKSTSDQIRFKCSMIRGTQHMYAKQITAAGGQYEVFVHNLTTDEWFRIPYQKIWDADKEQDKKSFLWKELTDYKIEGI